MKSDFERELDEIFSELDPKLEADARLALDIASQFTALRLRRGLSQGQLAERLGKSQQAVSKIENPRHEGHNLARLKEAVEALDATLDVTLVPREDLDAYRAEFVAKPALDRRVAPNTSAAEDSGVPPANRDHRNRRQDGDGGAERSLRRANNVDPAGPDSANDESEHEEQRATNGRRATRGRAGGAVSTNPVRRR